jgi:cell division septation protein DedD
MTAMQDNESMEAGTGGNERHMELQLGGRHLTMVVVGLALFGVVLFLLGRWSERVARPEAPAGQGIAESPLPAGREAPDPAQPRELTFYETLGKKSTPGFRQSSGSGGGEPPANLPETASPPPAAPAPAPASVVRKSKEPAPAAAPAGTGDRYKVQIASTRDAASARQLVERFRQKGYAASLDTVRGTDGRTQYKVRVGSFTERGPAEEEAARIRSREKVGAWIVKVQG